MVMQQRDAEAVPQALLYAIRLPGNSPSGQHCGGKAPPRTASYSAFIIFYCVILHHIGILCPLFCLTCP